MDRLDFLLHGYDRVLKQFLVDGFRFGFHIHFVGKRFSSESPNLKSAVDQPVVPHAKLHKECDVGRIVGPFTAPPFPNFRRSPLGIVPKKDPSEFRLTHHLSNPKGSSANDFIGRTAKSVTELLHFSGRHIWCWIPTSSYRFLQ